MTIARQIAEYAAGLTYEDLGDAVVREVCRRWYDSAGCALGAWEAPPAVIARRLALRVTGSPGADFPGSGGHLSSPELA
ncbi:MAG: MmgE/PrpD family protein, partial [Planctomycetaceae bacterium]|nr:MmgE/PrpD family protein [Planctomycetaceae bacterium]